MQYRAPTSLADAVDLLASAQGSARVMAGGTDLLARFASGLPQPELLLDIKHIPETTTIVHHSSGAFTVGAAVCGAQINEHEALRAAWPGVVEAMDLIGSVQIQGRASLGGNLCNASPAADSVPAMLAADMRCRIVGSNGERVASIDGIIRAPGQTSLARDEFIVSFDLAAPQKRSADAYLRMIPRTEMDIAIAGAAVWLALDEESCISAARVALGAVSPIPLLVPAAAELLVGSSLDEDTLARLQAKVSSACRPINDKRGTIEYRNHVAGVLAARAAAIAYHRASGLDDAGAHI